MEFVKKMKNKWLVGGIWGFVLLFLTTSCGSNPLPLEPIIVYHNPLVLQEITPLPRAVVVAQVVQDYEPVYTTFRIIEVSEVNGVQKNFLTRMGANKTGIAVGGTGEMAEDSSFQKIIGNYKIIGIEGDFLRCEIIEQDYRITTNAAYARIQTGEKLKDDAVPK
jgi:hypothetical protein